MVQPKMCDRVTASRGDVPLRCMATQSDDSTCPTTVCVRHSAGFCPRLTARSPRRSKTTYDLGSSS